MPKKKKNQPSTGAYTGTVPLDASKFTGKPINIGTPQAPMTVPEGSPAHLNWMAQQKATLPVGLGRLGPSGEALPPVDYKPSPTLASLTEVEKSPYEKYFEEQRTLGKTAEQISQAWPKTPQAIEATVGQAAKQVGRLTVEAGKVAPTATPTAKAPVTPTPTPTAAPTAAAPAPAAPEQQIDQLAQSQQKMFEDFTKQMTQMQEQATEQQSKLLEQMQATATTEATEAMRGMQESVQQAFEQYRSEFETTYQNIAQQGQTAIENLQKYREQQGLPAAEAMLSKHDQTIIDTETLLVNLSEDIKARTSGLPVSESARRRLEAMEGAPLEKRLAELLRGRQRVAAGLEAKQATVQQFMGAQQADIARQERLAKMRLGFGREAFGVEADLATQSQNIMSDLQSRLFDISKMQLGAVVDEASYRQNLLSAGFDFYSTMMAETRADIKDEVKFERELIKEQLKNDLKATDPTIKDVEYREDRAGRTTQIVTYTDGTSEVRDLGVIGKGVTEPKPTAPTATEREQAEITNARNLLTDFGQRDYVSGGYYEQVRAQSTISPAAFDRRFGYLLSEADRVKLGLRKEEADLSKWELERSINQWLASPEAQGMSEDEKAAQIRIEGFNPEDFGIY